MGEDAFGKVVGFDLIVDRELLDFRDQPVVPSDRAPQEALVSQKIQAAVLGVALSAGPNKRQVTRRVGLQKPPLKPGKERLRRAVAAVSGRSDGIAILN
jgi:hypothetical protein